MADLPSLSAAHLANVGGFEPQRANNALLFITDITDLTLNVAAGVGTVTSGSGHTNVLTLALDSFKIPQTEVAITSARFLNEARKFAGEVTHEDMTVTFKDFVDAEVAAALKQWHAKVYNPYTGKIGYARDYKKNGLIELYGPDGTAVRSYTVIGIWPSLVNHGQIDMASTDMLKIEVTFAVDRVVPRADVSTDGDGDPKGLRNT
jgi:hypothetical protein